MRAFRFEVLNEPKPGQATLSPLIADEMTRSKNSAIVRSASAFDTPAFCDTASINSALVISLPCFPGYGLPLNIYLTRFANKMQVSRAISKNLGSLDPKIVFRQKILKKYPLTRNFLFLIKNRASHQKFSAKSQDLIKALYYLAFRAY